MDACPEGYEIVGPITPFRKPKCISRRVFESRFRVRAKTVGRSGVTPEARREPGLEKQGPGTGLNVAHLSLRYGVGLADARCVLSMIPAKIFDGVNQLFGIVAPYSL